MDRTVIVQAEPLTAETFDPFGQVVGPDRARTTGFYATTFSRRLGFSMQDEEACLIVVESAYVPWRFHAMERHLVITQTFVTLDGAPSIMVVAAPSDPNDPNDIPKPGQIRAFHMDGSQSVLLWRGTWHALDVIERMTGSRPLGWFLGRPSPNTRRLIVEEGGFLYDSDAFNDDLPYWVLVDGKPHLILPYSVDNNDIRYTRGQGLEVADEFFTYLKDCFDWLYREGRHAPRMMSVGLHCRLIGRPGRMAALERFLDHVQKHDNVWICRRVEIARHWRSHHAFSA